MQNLKSVNDIIHKKPAVILYFSTSTCNVCRSLKPKLIDAVQKHINKFEIIDIDIATGTDVAASFNVFAIPTVLFFLEGKEFLRKSRHMSIGEVIREIKRPYDMLFDA